jgi:rhodanese-related sulfurtransferase
MTRLPSVLPGAVIDRLNGDPGEWAFIDLREAGQAAEGHPFASVNLPFSGLEAACPRLLPRTSTPLVLIDDGDGLADRAGVALAALGYTDLSAVAGGIPGWQAAGLPLFKGVHSFSKAFGEWVEHRFATPDIGPDDLAHLMAEPDPPALIDGRPFGEHSAFTLPGSRCCPNAELALRLPAMVADDVPVIIHCAGRTRSIIGAQTVRDFGLPNPVMALRDGTQGWELAGHARVTGSNAAPPEDLPPAVHALAIARAQGVINRCAIPTMDAQALDAVLRSGTRTVYRFDPRTDAEGTPPPGFVRAPATTLVQQTDRFIAVRGALVVVSDPALVRAVFAALWLRRMGMDAVIVETPPAVDVARAAARADRWPMLDARRVSAAQTAGALLIDVRPSAAFLAGHIDGAVWSIRPRLQRLGQVASAVVLGDDAAIAALVADDLAATGCDVQGLNTGTPDDWRAVDLAVVQGDTPATADRIDQVLFCAGRHSGNLDDARAYLTWETGLLDRLSAAGIMPWPTL